MQPVRAISARNRLLVTGGAGFIGSNLVLHALQSGYHVVNVDKLSYAAGAKMLSGLCSQPNYRFVQADIGEDAILSQVLNQFRPTAIIHLAAETHVDKSISNAADFVAANVVGSFRLLTQAMKYWDNLDAEDRDKFRFVHVSTDEVYGALPEVGCFVETSAYAPNSPYSATKAAADHLARAWHHTYGFPVLVVHPSNNYGPNQHPEKLIPRVIHCCLARKPIPVFGNGQNVRDWLYVEDCCDALIRLLLHGKVGESYNVGGDNPWRNLDLVHRICTLVDELAAAQAINNSQQLIRFVEDRPGHDFRYAMDCRKIRELCDWRPQHTAESGFKKTVEWYLNHTERLGLVQSGEQFVDNYQFE